MRKPVLLLLVCLCCAFLFSCAAADDEQAKATPDSVKSLETASDSKAESDSVKSSETSSDSEHVDVDLSVLSGTVVYAEVYAIMMEPEKYFGQVIKIQGKYIPYYDEGTKKFYHAVVIEDATACCQNGFEFVWRGEHKYPDDYPKENAEIEITGTLQNYDEEGFVYYYLDTDAIDIVD